MYRPLLSGKWPCCGQQRWPASAFPCSGPSCGPAPYFRPKFPRLPSRRLPASCTAEESPGSSTPASRDEQVLCAHCLPQGNFSVYVSMTREFPFRTMRCTHGPKITFVRARAYARRYAASRPTPVQRLQLSDNCYPAPLNKQLVGRHRAEPTRT